MIFTNFSISLDPYCCKNSRACSSPWLILTQSLKKYTYILNEFQGRGDYQFRYWTSVHHWTMSFPRLSHPGMNTDVDSFKNQLSNWILLLFFKGEIDLLHFIPKRKWRSTIIKWMRKVKFIETKILRSSNEQFWNMFSALESKERKSFLQKEWLI